MMTRKLELINTIVLINTVIQTTEVREFRNVPCGKLLRNYPVINQVLIKILK